MRHRARARRLTAHWGGAAVAVAAIPLLSLVATACTGDDDGGGPAPGGSSERAEYVEALVATSDDPEFSDAENRCLAEALVDGVGLDQLSEAATPAEIRGNEDFEFSDLGIELTEEQRDAFYEQLRGCLDLRELVVSSLTEGSDQAVVDCVDEQLGEDQLRTMVLAVLTENTTTRTETVQGVLADIYMECVGALPPD